MDMKKFSFFKVLLFIIPAVFITDLNAQITGFNKIRWTREKIAPGLVWKSSHTVINDSVAQNFNMLIINLNKRKISLFYNAAKNIVVSKQAEEAAALAAVNAGFFNIKDGGSVTYIRTGGVIAESDTAKKWTKYENMNGSVLTDNSGHVTIDHAKTNSWYDSHPEYPDVLVTGPLLLSGKEKVILPSTSLVIGKHPRTAIGRKGSHKIILLTLDGRTSQAHGMTLIQLADFMLLLGCEDAVNLDGGGSTTMWISGKPFNGIVNMPCDNKKFDHAGERAVSDILIVK
jgi:exopolysaccharide biosynthesis protein